MEAPLSIHCAIVGAGLGGLAAAIGLRRAGHRVTILEQASALGEIGAGIQIPPNCSKILRRWGLLDKIEAVSTKPQNVIVRSYRGGSVLNQQNLFPFTQDHYSEPYLHIHRADYHRVLVDEARRLGVEIRLAQAVTRIDFEKSAAMMKDGTSFQADLIIGADGLKSVCRESLLGHPDPPHLTGDLAYRVIIPASEMLKHPELERFASTPNINMWLGPQGHVVSYLLGGGRFNMVLICPDNLPELVNTAKADLSEMRELFKDWDPALRRMLDLVPETSKWRLQNSQEMSSWSHPNGNFVLLGDACHATLPYIAQGAAMAVEDGAVLGDLLARLSHRSEIPGLLAVYERLRKPRASTIVRRSTAARHDYHMPDGPEQAARDIALLRNDLIGDHSANPWADPAFRRYLFGYDSHTVAADAWTEWSRQTMATGHGSGDNSLGGLAAKGGGTNGLGMSPAAALAAEGARLCH